TRSKRDWSSDVCSSDLAPPGTESPQSAAPSPNRNQPAAVLCQRTAARTRIRPYPTSWTSSNSPSWSRSHQERSPERDHTSNPYQGSKTKERFQCARTQGPQSKLVVGGQYRF